MIKMEEILWQRSLEEDKRELNEWKATITRAQEKGDGCFDYSDEEDYDMTDFDCNIIYTDLLMQNVERGIYTYTDLEAEEIFDDAFIVGTARRICQIARNPRKTKKVPLHYGGRMMKQTVPLTMAEAQKLDQARHSYDYNLRRQWRNLQKIEEVPGYLKGREKARAIELAVWQASKGHEVRPREDCLPGETSADAKRRRLLEMIKGVPENFQKIYGLKKNWIHALQQQLPIGEFCYGEDQERSYSHYSQEDQSQVDYEDSTSEESEGQQEMPSASMMAPMSADYRTVNLPQYRGTRYYDNSYYHQYDDEEYNNYNHAPTTGNYTVGGSSSSGANS